MLISIGILARNEESVVEATLVSLFRQSALEGSGNLAGHTWEIIVVANGCSDQTAAVCRRVLAERVTSARRQGVAWAVYELSEGGKSNAWNHFVHTLSDRRAGVIMMLDADIEFREPETLSRTLNALLADPHAVAAVDLPLKDALKKRKKSLIQRISVATSGEPPIGLCGQFFCARAEALRLIWMPKGLSVEDGFLGAMICTDCMRAPIDNRKLIRAENAGHYFATLTSLSAIFRHELRLVIGTTLNCYLVWDFLLFATDPEGPGAGALIRNHLNRNPDWYTNLIANAIQNRGWWVLPRGMFFRRFSAYAQRRGSLRWLLVATLGFLFDLPVFLFANYRLKKGTSIGYW